MTDFRKFPIPPGVSDVRLEMPCGARVLTIDEDSQGQPCIWAQVDPSVTITEERRFHIVSAGPVETRVHIYLGTFVVRSGMLYHVFNVPAKGSKP